MSPPDIVFPVRTGEHNPELRHALRTLSNIPHGRVWIAGYMPTWVQNCGHVQTVQRGTKHQNSLANLLAACSLPHVAEDFILWNDDMFLLEPIEEIPILHRGTIAKFLEDKKHTGNSAYFRGLAETLRLLRILGHDDPLCYEMHIPLPMTKSGVIEARAAIAGEGTPRMAIQMRSLFGNLAKLGGEQARDVKVFGAATKWESSTFLSTSDSVWPRHPAAEFVKQKFRTPGPYERTP